MMSPVVGPGANLFDTAPPEPDLCPGKLQRLKRYAALKLSAAILAVGREVVRSYTSGESIDDAIAVALNFGDDRSAATIGYWNEDCEEEGEVADLYRRVCTKLRTAGLNAVVAIKPPVLRYSPQLAQLLAVEASASRLHLHCDSHAHETADLSWAMVDSLREGLHAGRLGTTLPGRWVRSLGDADRAVADGISLRVVKGQWPDPADPGRDLAQGFLAVVDRLAGRARHVGVATHDASLAMEAIGRLRAAGTPCELEVLLGMAPKSLTDWARQNGVTVRVYVPFGPGFAPNAIGLVRRNPRLLYTVAKGQLAAATAGLKPAARREA